jgi:hypothetical protein
VVGCFTYHLEMMNNPNLRPFVLDKGFMPD